MTKTTILILLVCAGCSAAVTPMPIDAGHVDADVYDGAAPCPATAAECAGILFCPTLCHYDDGGSELDAGVDASLDAGDAGVDARTGCTSAIDCDDADPCTADVCDAAGAGCTHTSTGTCAASFAFPEHPMMRTDTRVLATSPYWTTPGDHEEKSVTLAAVPYVTHLAIDDVHFYGASCASPGSFRILLNGVEVGSFTGVVGTRTPYAMSFSPIAGPTYVVRLEETTPGSDCMLEPAGATGSTTTLSAGGA